jgi:RNase P subunit RPR2
VAPNLRRIGGPLINSKFVDISGVELHYHRAALTKRRRDVLALDSKLPFAFCTECRKPMKPGAPKPILLTKNLAELTYTCQTCGATTKRTIREEKT